MSDESDYTITPPARNFNQLISEIEGGELHQVLSESVQNMVAELIDHRMELGGKPKGTVSLKLNIKLDGETVDITPEVKITMPKIPRARTIFYVTPENNLSRANPKQRTLPLKEVSTVDPETGEIRAV